MTIEGVLSADSIERMVKELGDYIKRLEEKAKRISSELAEYGIDVCRDNANNGYAKYVYFTKDVQEVGATTLLIAQQIDVIHAEWVVQGGMVKYAEVSPLLMLEFGYGNEAENLFPVREIGGQGTFPKQTHAFDVDGWWFKDLEGVWHHFDGVIPQAPMWNAFEEMARIAKKVVRDVLSED